MQITRVEVGNQIVESHFYIDDPELVWLPLGAMTDLLSKEDSEAIQVAFRKAYPEGQKSHNGWRVKCTPVYVWGTHAVSS